MVLFSRKSSKKIHPEIFCNNISVRKADFQNHLGLHLDLSLSFDNDIKTVLTKMNRTTVLLQKFQQILPRPPLIIISKAPMRSHLWSQP